MSSDIVLRVEGLGKSYRSYRAPTQRLRELLLGNKRTASAPIHALKDVSFTLRRGEILGVIGPNGAGKSTLLQLIAGTLRPSEGCVTVDGRLTALLELGAGVDPEMTGRENIFLMGATYGLAREAVQEQMEAIVDFSGLGTFIEQPVKTYSSGMFVRLAFSVSTALEPDVLIVDEALSVGDVGFQAKCLDRLEALIQNGSSILLASHDLQLIKSYCSSAICLNNGEVVESGDPEKVTERYFSLMRGNRQGGEGSLHWENTQGKSVRFGNGSGIIDSVELETAGKGGIVTSGELVSIHVAGRVLKEDCCPRVSVMVRDARGYNLYGLSAGEGKRGVCLGGGGEFSESFSIPMHLADGQYSLTVRLEDHRTVQVAELLDKHVGVCHFTVEGAERKFLGTVNMFGSVQANGGRGDGEDMRQPE